MDKRYRKHNNEQRPMCTGDDNTCTNLADYKETRAGVRQYKTKCSRHRRAGKNSLSFDNPRSRRYIPLVDCEICGGERRLERHRIQRDTPYTPKRVVVLCQDCHNKVHKFERVLASKNYYIKRRRELRSRFEN